MWYTRVAWPNGWKLSFGHRTSLSPKVICVFYSRACVPNGNFGDVEEAWNLFKKQLILVL